MQIRLQDLALAGTCSRIIMVMHNNTLYFSRNYSSRLEVGGVDQQHIVGHDMSARMRAKQAAFAIVPVAVQTV